MSKKDPETIRSLLIKIKALADNGVRGERDNAQRILKNRLDKYGLSIDDLTETQKQRRWFRYRTEWEKRILYQIVIMVLQSNDFSVWSNRSKVRQDGFDLTLVQFKEISTLYEHYKKEWKSDIEDLLFAFVQKHELYKESDEGGGKLMSLEETKKLVAMMNAINSETYREPVKLLEGAVK